MIVLMARHAVQDLNLWLEAYRSDAALAVRKASGVTSDAVHVLCDNPQKLMVTHHFASREEAEAFLNLPEFQEALKQMGVIEPIEIELYETL